MSQGIRTLEEACLDIQYLVIGLLENNVYILDDGAATFVVDPTADVDRILQALGDRKLDAIILTHHHFDHMGAAYDLRERTGAKVMASATDAPYIEDEDLASRDMRKKKVCPVDQKLHDGDIVQIGNMAWKVLATPGHTKGSICLFIDPRFGTHPEGRPVLISGDTLFCGTIGRTDFEGGSMADMRKSLKKLAFLPDETIVLTGHNDLTSIGDERQRVFAHFA